MARIEGVAQIKKPGVSKEVQSANSVPAPVKPGTGELGGAVFEVAQRTQAAEERLQNRRESLARQSITGSAESRINEEFLKFNNERDITNPNDLAELGASYQNIINEERAKFQGSEIGGLTLDEQLTDLRDSRVQDAATFSAGQSKRKTLEQFGSKISVGTRDVALDPDNVDAILANFNKFATQEGGSVNPNEDAAFRKTAASEFYDMAITSHLMRGNSDRAKALFAREDVAASLGEERVATIAANLDKTENKKREALNQATSAMALAGALAKPGAPEADIQADARRLVGLAPDRDLQFFQAGTKVFAIDKQTGEKVSTFDIPAGEGKFVTGEELEDESSLPEGVEGGPFFKPAGGGAVQVLVDPQKTEERIQGEAKAKALGQQAADNQFIKSIFDSAGLDDQTSEGLSENAQQSPTFSALFGPEFGNSEDAQSVARLFTLAQRLSLTGSERGRALGTSLLSQARFIAENSEQMRREQDLDKPISAEQAQMFGLPLGTTLRDVVGKIPPTVAAVAEERAGGTARGRAKIEAEEQNRFTQQGITLIDDLLEDVVADPGILGIAGSLRSTGQTAINVISDLGGQSLINSAVSIGLDSEGLSVTELFELFENPRLSTLDILGNAIGLSLARTLVPTGRVPVEVIRRSIEDTKLTGLRGQKQIIERLNFVKGLFELVQKSRSQLFGAGDGASVPTVKLKRDESGRAVGLEGRE